MPGAIILIEKYKGDIFKINKLSFILNSKFVFNENGEKPNFWKALIKVYASYSITGLFLTAILLYLEEQILGIPHYIATLMNLVVTIPINFLLNKFWAYKDKGKNKKDIAI